jgi:hypothetical protein
MHVMSGCARVASAYVLINNNTGKTCIFNAIIAASGQIYYYHVTVAASWSNRSIAMCGGGDYC